MTQEKKILEKKVEKLQSTPQPYDVAGRVLSAVQGYFKVGQSPSNPGNIRFSRPQAISNKQSDSFFGGYCYSVYILKNTYIYQISITIGHHPLQKKMAAKWDIFYTVRRYKGKLRLIDKLLGEKFHDSKYVRGDYLKTIDTKHINQDELIAELSISSIYLLEDLIENYINGVLSDDSRQTIPARITARLAQSKILGKLAAIPLPSVVRHRLSFN